MKTNKTTTDIKSRVRRLSRQRDDAIRELGKLRTEHAAAVRRENQETVKAWIMGLAVGARITRPDSVAIAFTPHGCKDIGVPKCEGTVTQLHLGTKHVGLWIKWDGTDKPTFVRWDDLYRHDVSGYPPATTGNGRLRSADAEFRAMCGGAA